VVLTQLAVVCPKTDRGIVYVPLSINNNITSLGLAGKRRVTNNGGGDAQHACAPRRRREWRPTLIADHDAVIADHLRSTAEDFRPVKVLR
jgi:hypothetical protein